MQTVRTNRNRRRSGQTLVAAIFVLGVLLILGFVFIGIVNRNILQSGTARERTQANDLAEAGIRFAHAQLLYSPLGADWRGFPTAPASNRDPDFDLLLPDPDGDPTNGDQGGPDGLGAFTRVNQGNGRFLVRVRYAPSDAFLFSTAPTGPLRQPGKARNYLIVESVGRIGRVSANDPTTLLGRQRRESRKLIAFASIGMIEHAMYITDKDRTATPAEIGAPRPFGIRYEGVDVSPAVQIGSALPMYNFGNPPLPTLGPILQGGGLFSNANLNIHGLVDANLNAPLGDSWIVNGLLRGADNSAVLTLNRAYWDTGLGMWQTGQLNLSNTSNPSLDSRSLTFTTFFGLLRDGIEGTDIDGFWRSAGRKEPPSILNVNPDTGQNRYHLLTRSSGALLAAGNAGRFGHGNGPYINNSSDRQMRSDEQGREDVGSAESLVYDWFNPNNGQANSGWVGPYYVPRGAYMLLLNDGFLIIRDARGPVQERTWRTPDGLDTGSQGIRFRVGSYNGQPYIINSYTPGANINSASPNFAAGRPFNGVVYYEGNVRVRGVIPTDVQLTVVSNATIYVEGGITKGIVRNFVTDPNGPPNPPQRLNRPTRSMLMLMAKDYVALNTTMFFGPGPGQSPEEVNEANSPIAWNPIRMRTGGGTFTFRSQIDWDPNSSATPNLPNTWLSYPEVYAEFGAPANRLNTKLLVSHATDDGPAPYTFVSVDVNYGLPTPNYFFAMTPPNSAAPFFLTPYGAIYGLGSETWQRYPKFESMAFDLLDPNAMSVEQNGFVLRANTATTAGDYRMLVGDMNDVTFRHNNVGFGATNDYLIARAAIVPHDVRIEASMYAEEGSFAVIPGNWYNPNPNDTRELFEQRVADYQSAPFNLSQADAVRAAWKERLDNVGAGPDMPFFSEPLDVRVTILGSVSQNMPLPMSYQADWLRKWGWIPRRMAALYRISGSSATPVLIPQSHVPQGYDISLGGPDRYVPNLVITYDQGLATASLAGFATDYLRRDRFGRPLPPMPCLPVSPALSYFGEVLR